ncbi:tryptophan synthase subunit alpha [Trichlorobacter ammonificans]|uniref:Tryptophan synthase alpha chain n=1 Tax=Trichlorobacter ammonificans TaxID=2916410 RepID=A0ABM9D592_9BACT|nr:tryptophan synthase subunit alpha [Trichlorobacter ammonificans]CAH2030413.1 Tryptophan synthase alpha chain [Trichlorobacter ammonificans]
MNKRIAAHLTSLRKTGRKALVTFITAGDPDLATTATLLPLLERAGVDIIELGIPFSDPMADGPTIQRASERALAAGTTLSSVLELVQSVRPAVTVPIVLMGYSNPIYHYGWERFAVDAAAAGVDGLLLVDLPPEEADELLPVARSAGLDLIFLLTPTSGPDRIARVARSGSGFLYYVTVTGVTGARQHVSQSLSGELAAVRSAVRLPVMAGFGISTPEQAALVAADADGVVVGSAIVKLFEQYRGEQLQEAVTALVGSLKLGISHSTRT